MTAPENGLVLGIGNELRGDDAAGMEIARRLLGRTGIPVLLAGEVPENYLGAVRERAPSRVLLLDAVDFKSAPGDMALFRLDGEARLANRIPSTHSASLALFARYLAAETGAEVWLLGVQPKSLEFGQPLSREVAAALDAAVELALKWMERRPAAMEV